MLDPSSDRRANLFYSTGGTPFGKQKIDHVSATVLILLDLHCSAIRIPIEH